jgi:hypothetical protein
LWQFDRDQLWVNFRWIRCWVLERGIRHRALFRKLSLSDMIWKFREIGNFPFASRRRIRFRLSRYKPS